MTRRVVLWFYGIVVTVSTAGFLYIGYVFFSGRLKIFYIFSLYAIALGAVALLFGLRLLSLKFPK